MTKGQSRVSNCLHDTDPVLIKVKAADITGHRTLNGFTQGVHWNTWQVWRKESVVIKAEKKLCVKWNWKCLLKQALIMNVNHGCNEFYHISRNFSEKSNFGTISQVFQHTKICFANNIYPVWKINILLNTITLSLTLPRSFTHKVWFSPESWVKMACLASSSEVWDETSFFSSNFLTMASMIWGSPVFCRSSIRRVRLRKSSTSLKARISAWKSFSGTFYSMCRNRHTLCVDTHTHITRNRKRPSLNPSVLELGLTTCTDPLSDSCNNVIHKKLTFSS